MRLVFSRAWARIALISLLICGGALGSACTPTTNTATDKRGSQHAPYVVSYAPNLTMTLWPPPTRAHEPYPTVVFVHGGSFVSGSRLDVSQGIAGRIADALRAHGVLIASIDYRLCHGSTHIGDAADDVGRALSHLRREAARLNVDASRLALYGVSAGGTLALLHATDRHPPAVIAALGAPTDLVTSDPSKDLFSAFLHRQHDRLIPSGQRNAATRLSPLAQAPSFACPVLLVHGAADTIVSPAAAHTLAEALRAAHKDVTLLIVPSADHGLMTPAHTVSDEAVEAVVRTLLSALRVDS